MYTKRYKHVFNMTQSQLIDGWESISDEMIKIFGTIGPRRPHEYFRKNFDEMRHELKQKDTLISDVQFVFAHDLIQMRIEFLMTVTVNASFMPETVDDICQKYFDKIEEEMMDHFRMPDGHLATDDEITKVINSLIKNYGAFVPGWRNGHGEWMDEV